MWVNARRISKPVDVQDFQIQRCGTEDTYPPGACAAAGPARYARAVAEHFCSEGGLGGEATGEMPGAPGTVKKRRAGGGIVPSCVFREDVLMGVGGGLVGEAGAPAGVCWMGSGVPGGPEGRPESEG